MLLYTCLMDRIRDIFDDVLDWFDYLDLKWKILMGVILTLVISTVVWFKFLKGPDIPNVVGKKMTDGLKILNDSGSLNVKLTGAGIEGDITKVLICTQENGEEKDSVIVLTIEAQCAPQ